MAELTDREQIERSRFVSFLMSEPDGWSHSMEWDNLDNKFYDLYVQWMWLAWCARASLATEGGV